MFNDGLRYLRFFTKKAGAPPGVVGDVTEYSGDTGSAVIRIVYGPGKYMADDTDVFSPHAVAKGETVWIRVIGLGDIGVLKKVRDKSAMHPLLFEDIMNPGQDPATEIGRDFIFNTGSAYPIKAGEESGYGRYAVYFDGKTVYTFESGNGAIFDPLSYRIENNLGIIRDKGGAYLLYSILDTVADGFFVALDKISERTEIVEEEILGNPDKKSFNDLYMIKKEVLAFKRTVRLSREAYQKASRFGKEPEQEYYYSDLMGHMMQCNDHADSLREILMGLTDLYLSVSGNRMNEVMKVLTIAGSIFIPLTFLAGIYGMNFKFMPELELKWTYPALLSLMAFVAVGMLWLFKKKKWF